MNGKFIIFSAPSGSGKTTIVKYLLKCGLPLEFSISATSRKPRGPEVHGKDYYFLSESEFRKNIEDGNFIEWEEVYAGNFYGTLKSEVDRIWKNGNHVLFDIDVKGGVNLKKLFPDNTLSVFIMPPSVEELEHRLLLRSTDDAQTIQKRVAKATEEIKYADKFDLIIVNDKLEEAQDKAYKAVKEFVFGV
jgi:guanylate kinase